MKHIKPILFYWLVSGIMQFEGIVIVMENRSSENLKKPKWKFSGQ